MKITSRSRNGVLLVQLREPRLDAAIAIQFKDQMRTLTDTTDARVILDLCDVGFMDSSGLGAVVAAMKQLGAGRKLELSGLTPTVQKVFQLTRMDSVFTIHDNLDAVGDHVDAG